MAHQDLIAGGNQGFAHISNGTDIFSYGVNFRLAQLHECSIRPKTLVLTECTAVRNRSGKAIRIGGGANYVGAAISMGASDWTIMFKHILPNAINPVVSFAPFAIVGNIGALVALDFLGFGLPAPTPSWGELIGQGMSLLTKWWLVFFPLAAVFLTLLLIVFVGEAVREAFDPKQYSRLR